MNMKPPILTPAQVRLLVAWKTHFGMDRKAAGTLLELTPHLSGRGDLHGATTRFRTLAILRALAYLVELPGQDSRDLLRLRLYATDQLYRTYLSAQLQRPEA